MMASRQLKTWFTAAAAVTLALGCSGTRLNDVGDVTSNGGSGGGSDSNGEAGGHDGGASVGGTYVGGGAPPEPEVGGAGGDSGGVGGGGSGGGFGEAGHGPVEPGECGDGDNLLRNGGFEGVGLGFPDEWRRYGTPAEAVIWDHNVAAEGSSSVKMVMPTSYEYWSEQRIQAGCVTEGEVLRITGTYRSNRANTDIDVAVSVGDEHFSLPIPDEVDVWIPFSLQVHAPKPPFRVGFWGMGPMQSPATTLWVDDLAVTRVP
jgi:hypothetical protein